MAEWRKKTWWLGICLYLILVKPSEILEPVDDSESLELHE